MKHKPEPKRFKYKIVFNTKFQFWPAFPPVIDMRKRPKSLWALVVCGGGPPALSPLGDRWFTKESPLGDNGLGTRDGSPARHPHIRAGGVCAPSGGLGVTRTGPPKADPSTPQWRIWGRKPPVEVLGSRAPYGRLGVHSGRPGESHFAPTYSSLPASGADSSDTVLAPRRAKGLCCFGGIS